MRSLRPGTWSQVRPRPSGLNPLSFSPANFPPGTPTSGTIIGATPGSVLNFSRPLAGLTINSAARTWTFDGRALPGFGSFLVRETLSGHARDTQIAFSNVPAAVTLGDLSLSSTSFVVGTAAGGTIIGAAAGSAIAVTGQPTGFTINSVARTWAYDGTGTATSGSLTLTETLPTLGPKSTVIAFTVSAAAVVDTTPDAFSFIDATGVALSSTQTSNTITVAGVNAPATVTITGGTYSKNGGGYVSSAGTAVNGDTFAVRHTASASNSTATNTVLTIGGVSDTFTSTTLAEVPEGEPTYDATLIPPFIQLEGTRDTTPLVVIVQTDGSHALGGKYRLELDDDAAFGSPLPPFDYTPTADDFTDGTFSFGLDEVTDTQRIRGFWISADNKISGPSNVLLWGPNDVAPVLTNPTSFTSVTATGANGGVTTDWNDGTLYAVEVAAPGGVAAMPSDVQVEAGQNAVGTAAAWADDQAVTSPGEKSFTSSGLSATTQYRRFYMHKPAVGPRSAVMDGGTFTTGAASVFSVSEVDAVGAFPNYGGGANHTFAGCNLGAADANRKILVSLACFNDGGAITGVTVAGVAATQIDSNSVMSAWEAIAPTGTTGDVVVTTASGIVGIAIKLTRVVGASGSPTVAKLTSSYYEVAQMNLNVTTPTGGATVISAYWDATTARDFTGATKTTQTTFGTRSQAGAIRTTAGAGTVQVTGGGGTNFGMTAVSYAP